MTNEKFLEILTAIKGAYEYSDILSDETERASKATNDALEAQVKILGGIYALPFIVEQAVRAAKADIAEKAMSTPSKNRLSICKNILRDSKKATSREAFHYANTIDGVQYISNSYIIVALAKPLPLEEKPVAIPGAEFDKFFHRYLSDNDPLELPDRKLLAAYIKTAKAEQKPIDKKLKKAIRYNFGNGLPTVNAEYLAYMMDVFPDGKFYAKGNMSNIYIKSGDDEGEMCPLRKPDTDTEKTKLG